MNDGFLHFLEEWFASSELNRLHENYGGGRIFSSPLFGVASGDDPIFLKFKEVVAPDHLTPLEMWLSCGLTNVPASKLRIISIVFPFTDEIREKSKKPLILPRIKLPAEIYSVARNYANAFKEETCRQVIEFFKKQGYQAIAGMLSNAFNIMTKGRFYSTWSERHVAFAAGLGTFSLHEGLITEVGCNIRLASMLTNAPLEVNVRKSDDPNGNCLYHAIGNCRICEEKCPANAISEKGHDKKKYYNYEQKINRKVNARIGHVLKPHVRRINGELRSQNPPVGCAFCQLDVPCTDKNPMAGKKT